MTFAPACAGITKIGQKKGVIEPFNPCVRRGHQKFDLHSASQPNALTDLVIVNAPFGATTRTLAREVRMRSNRGFNELVAQVTLLVRQGLGRLVRSPDTPANRRIHWLDAKIHQPSTAGLLNPVRRVLAKYRQINVS